MKRWFRVRGKRETATKRNVNRLLGRLVGVSLLISATGMSIGCDSDSFVPPRPEELRSIVGGATDTANGSATSVGVPASGKAIELILDRHGADETEYLKTAARTQAGHDKAKIKIAFLGEKESSSIQAGLVREALAKHPLALVLEPADPSDPGLALAVREASGCRHSGGRLRACPLAGSQPVEAAHGETKSAKADTSPAPVQSQSQGGQTSSGSRPAAPLVLVTPVSFAPTAKLLVASAIRNAKNSGLDPEGGAVLLLDTKSDNLVEPRVTAVREALKDAGITKIKEIPFESDNTRATNLLLEYLNANPRRSGWSSHSTSRASSRTDRSAPK